ncbi:MAG: hypothetical protein AAF206_02820 [Bacteroidota bacterium]
MRTFFSLHCLLLLLSFSTFAATYPVTNTLDAGGGSLREAITLANANPGLDVISFTIAGVGLHTITLLSDLPDITDPVLIDGSTANGFAGIPLIEVDGNDVVNEVFFLTTAADGSHISALVVNHYLNFGMDIRAENCRVTNCFIGTDASGTLDATPGDFGLYIRNHNNIVGGANPGEGNLIGGNATSGIYVQNNQDSTIIMGNLIGTDINGTSTLPNGTGINCWGRFVELGSSTLTSRNIISGNTNGALLWGRKSIVQNNYIGVDITGTVALPNTGIGLGIFQDSSLVGGSLPSERNVISGNGSSGIGLSGANTFGSRISGNFIGTDYTGTVAIPNGQQGIVCNGGVTGVTIGGLTAGERNIISGNSAGGVGFNTGTGNYVYGNYIGPDVSGTVVIGSQTIGITCNSAGGNFFGNGTAAGANVISGNTNMGVNLNGPDSDSNQVKFNYIGTDPSGLLDLGNGNRGVYANGGAEDNEIGGLLPGEGNIIAFNTQGGVLINFSGSTRNSILGNRIYENQGAGIQLSNGNNNQAAPDITGYGNGPGTITFFGTLLSAPNTTYRLEFFSSSTSNQGQTLLGSTNVTTDGAGFYALNELIAAPINPSEPYFTATATDPLGNTSEFGAEVILPVLLTHFSLHPAGKNHLILHWELADTEDDLHFAIEHRQPGDDFAVVGEQSDFLQANGHRQYQFDVYSLAGGMHYFRLHARTAAGEAFYSSVLAFDNQLTEPYQLQVQNPLSGNDVLFLQVNESQSVDISLYTLHGAKAGSLFQGMIPGKNTTDIPINTSHFARGTYLLEVKGRTFRNLRKVVIL